MGLSNDERGWLLTMLSGIACVFGASLICIDLIIRRFPNKRDFRIQDSDTFLSLSLSLSFGVMLFSALYSMLPSAKKSLQEGGFSPKAAAWILIVCFLGGVGGIQVLSRVLHSFMPSHVVGCEHSHGEEGGKGADDHGHEHGHGHGHGHERPAMIGRPRTSSLPGHMPMAPKQQKLAARHSSYFGSNVANGSFAPTQESEADGLLESQLDDPPRRPSLQQRFTTGIAQLTTKPKPKCDCDGPCYGFSDVCGAECFKNVSARGGTKASFKPSNGLARPPMSKSATAAPLQPTEQTPLLGEIAEERRSSRSPQPRSPRDLSPSAPEDPSSHRTSSQTLIPNPHLDARALHKTHSHETTSSHNPDRHHHHVPTNAFLSIGLQTSLAIALHKLPEGFITYATNHANPTLGFSVFLALSIHNITEGFALALPLYLALNSRPAAMAWAFVLGGLSQPLGAGVAALWFKVAGKGDWAPEEGVYGGMFAITAGVMVSVALQLFGESVELTHSRGLCMVGAFVGMGILGVSGALTA